MIKNIQKGFMKHYISGQWRRQIKLGDMPRCKNSAGFTLIELLVAITIIGVLSAVLFANFIGVRARARDSQRKSDLRQIQAALELYKADAGSYPSQLYSTDCSASSQLSSGTIVYLNKIPCDPNPPTAGCTTVNACLTYKVNLGNYVYIPSGADRAYSILACLENKNDNDPNAQDTGGFFCTTSRKAFILNNP